MAGGGGLRPTKYHDRDVRSFLIPASDSTAVAKGDPVIRQGDLNTGVIKTASSEYQIGVLETVIKASMGDGNEITGVVVDIEPLPADLFTNYRVADTARVVHVNVNPDTVYELVADGALTAAASVGLNGVLIDEGIDTLTGESGVKLDSGTSDAPAADASNQLLILSASDRPDLDYSAATRFLVKINQSTETNADAVLGIS